METVNISGKLNRRRYIAKQEQLDQEAPLQNLERIEVRAVKPKQTGARVAAHVSLYWPGEGEEPGDFLPFDDLQEGESVLVSVSQGIRVKLEKRRAGRIPVWLAVLVVLALTMWAGAFVYLCILPSS